MATEKELIQAISEINNVENLREIFGAIAIALRAKGVEKKPIYPEEFADLIDTIETGLNTDDADAQGTDIARNKTAYVKGAKVTGSIPEVMSATVDQQGSISLSSPGTSDTRVTVTTQLASDTLFRSGSKVQANVAGSEFGTATTDDVLSGKTFTAASGLRKTGTLIPQTGTDTSSATATASDIRNGRTAFGPNGKITGAMPDAGSISGQLGATSIGEWSSSDPNRGSGTVSITNVNQTAGYTNGYSNGSLIISVPANRLLKGRTITPTTSEQSVGEAEDILYGPIKVAGASTLIPSNIKKGVSIFNVTGTMETGIDTSDATATADDIAYEKTAYVDGSKVTGRIQVIPKGIATPFTRSSNYDLSFYSSTILIRTLDNGAKKILEVGAGVEFAVPAERFGDATADDVAAGKTFTSISGLRIMGTGSTAKMSRNAITQSTSATSLSFTFPLMADRNFKTIFLYPNSNIINTWSGAVSFVILERGSVGDFIVGTRGICLSNGNYYIKETGIDISIVGTTITLTNTDGYIFSSGDWLAIGTPFVQAN